MNHIVLQIRNYQNRILTSLKFSDRKDAEKTVEQILPALLQGGSMIAENNELQINLNNVGIQSSPNYSNLIIAWAMERNLIEGSSPERQMMKLVSEMGELAEGIAKKKPAEIKDGIGDCSVVLRIIAEQCGFKYEDCVESAYNEIKDRKGKMIDGVFVKEVK